MSGRRPWRKASDFPDRSDRFDDSDGAYLGDVDSSLVGFGETGQRGFSDAWDETSVDIDDAAAEFSSDESDIRNRDLDARSGRWKVALVLVAALAVAGWFAYSEGIFDGDVVATPNDEVLPTLIAPSTPRVYEAGPTSIALATSGSADSMFVTPADGENPVPHEDVELVQSFEAGPILWAGRTHVVLTGPGIDAENLCLVATLVSDSLVTIDLAAAGDCAVELGATGDRLACGGEEAVMLEVWPFDPRAATKPPTATAIRFRVEQRLEDGTVQSQRGSVTLPAIVDGDALLSSAAVLGGGPGDVVTIDGYPCTLVDRSDIAIQLLPS